MNKPSKEFFIFKRYIDDEKNNFSDYLYLLVRLPLNLIEWLIRYLPGPIGIISRRIYYKIILKRVGKNVIIDEGVYFQGNNIILDDWSYIDKFCVLTSISEIKIGKRVHLGIGSIIHAGLDSEVIIDDNTAIAARCNFFSASNAYAPNKRMAGPMAKSNQVMTKYGKIHIGKDCFIGLGSTILPNVEVGFASIVAAGALIKKNLKEKCIFNEKGELIRERVFDEKKFYN